MMMTPMIILMRIKVPIEVEVKRVNKLKRVKKEVEVKVEKRK